MSARQRKTRTPEEIAKSMETARAIMKEQKKRDAIDSVKWGRAYVLVAGLYFLIIALFIEYYGASEIAYYFFGITAFYVLLAFVYMKNPLMIASIALAIFVCYIIFMAILSPRSLFEGLILFIIKIMALVGLISAIRSAWKYKKEVKEMQLISERDDEIIDSF